MGRNLKAYERPFDAATTALQTGGQTSPIVSIACLAQEGHTGCFAIPKLKET